MLEELQEKEDRVTQVAAFTGASRLDQRCVCEG